MRKFIFSVLVLLTLSKLAWAEDHASKDTVSPCESSAATNKPDCSMDSDSINIPPKIPNDNEVIVPPEVPPQGLPNRKQPQKRDLPTTQQKSENPEMR